ncbi:hypothetical protein AX15_006189 [Amanita polypyramis BW_CC]|nr:hypothetical protein AX15_006189 [Amanita polypyramis BW_CC]
MMMMMLLSFFTLLLSATYVAAHGFVHQVIIDGQAFPGNSPGSNSVQSIIRTISTIDPVKGAMSSEMNCGWNPQPAALVGDAMPGSTVAFDWRAISLSSWFHNTGPIMTYMASCGDTTCDKYNTAQAKWFLIDRQGQSSNGTWAQASLTQGAMATVKIPSNLAAGNYMIRSEIIALQNAVSEGGAEFYPSCTQLRVGGSQSGMPSSSDLVSLPGAYKDSDPGILDPNVYNPGASYTFPGPSVASFIAGGGTSSSGNNSGSGGNSGGSSYGSSGGSSGGNSSATSSNNASPSDSSSAQPSASTGSSKSCRLRHASNSTSNSTSSYARRALQYHRQHNHRPRSLSRVMRGLVLGNESQ